MVAWSARRSPPRCTATEIAQTPIGGQAHPPGSHHHGGRLHPEFLGELGGALGAVIAEQDGVDLLPRPSVLVEHSDISRLPGPGFFLFALHFWGFLRLLGRWR